MASESSLATNSNKFLDPTFRRVLRRTDERFELVGKLFKKIRRFLTSIRRKRRRRSHLILVKVRFDRDCRIPLGPDTSLAQPPELSSGGTERTRYL